MRSALLPLLMPLLAATGAVAAPVRITAWDLSPANRSSVTTNASFPEDRLKEIAASLRALTPDVIFLRGMPSQLSAERLAASLRPQVYRVILWSSFAAGPGSDLGARPVAILSKEPAFGFQAVDWAKVGISNLPGGFVFAGFRYGKEPFCFYGLQFDDSPVGTLAATQDQGFLRQLGLCSKYLTRHMNWVEQKLTNQSVGLVVASQLWISPSRSADLNIGRLLETRGFKSLAPKAAPDGRISSVGQPTAADWFEETLVRNLALSSRPRIGRPPALGRFAVTYDLAAGLGTETAEAGGGKTERSRGRLLSGGRIFWLVAGAVALVLLPSMFWYARWRRHDDDTSEEPVPTSSRPAFTVFERGVPVPLGVELPVTTETTDTDVALWQSRALRAEQQAEHATAILRQGLVSHLADWLKQKIVVGLLSQRDTLLDSSRNGSVHLAELEGRLGRIQEQLQKRLHLQQQRIAELEREVAAKERIIQLFRQHRV